MLDMVYYPYYEHCLVGEWGVLTMSNKPDRVTFQKRLDEMVSTLRRDILTSVRPPGDYLPSELALAEQYMLSKKSVRKGLELLVEEGLITKEPRVGNRINAPAPVPKVSLKLGCYPSLDDEMDLKGLLEQFHAQYPHISVDTITLPYTHYPEAIQGYLENGWVDVLSLNTWNFREMLEHGELDRFLPLEPDPEAYSFLGDYLAHEGRLYARPLTFSPVVLCYNKTLFRKWGMPEPDSSWSWKQLAETAAHIQREHQLFGFYAHIASTNRFPIVLLQKHFRFAQEEGGYRYDDPKLWDSLGMFRELIYGQGLSASFLSESDGDAEKLFLQQKTAMVMTTYYGLKMLKQADFEYDLAPLPYEQSAKTLLLVTGLAVNRQSKQKEAARLLVDFLGSAAAQLHIRKETLSIPARKSSAEWDGAETMYRPSRFNLYREIVPTFSSYADLGITMEELHRLRNELKLFWANMEQAQDAAARLASRLGVKSRQ